MKTSFVCATSALLSLCAICFNGCCSWFPSMGWCDPVLSVSLTSMDFGDAQNSMSCHISNQGGGTLTWSTASDKPWLAASPNSGTTKGETDEIIVTVNRGLWSEGSQNGFIRIQSNGGDLSIAVSATKLGGTDTYSFTPEPITRLCPDQIGGDREFDGHGPTVTASAALSIRNNSREIWVTMDLHEKETKSDWTEAKGHWERLLWSVPSGYRIVDITSDLRSEANYTDVDHSLDVPPISGGRLVNKFEIMGDTGGNDVGNCTDDDAYMNIYFNEIRGNMRKIQ